MAAKKAAISISCFLAKRCGIQIGSFAIKVGWLYNSTFLFKKSFKENVVVIRYPHQIGFLPCIMRNIMAIIAITNRT